MLDACVLYPTVMREVLLGVAAKGLYEPIWSERVLEEWARAARKLGATGEPQARAEIALVRAAWPEATRPEAPGVAARLWLPDENDIHVLAVAVDAGADAIMTLNARDFPHGILAEDGLQRIAPDSFLTGLLPDHRDAVEMVGRDVLRTAREMSGTDWDMRQLMKKARLPRLGKALSG